jgi:Domain of unknown function (DUF5658)
MLTRHNSRYGTQYMATALQQQPPDRRRLPERRARPTTFFGALHWKGRRQGFRRAGEGRCAYVDCVAWRIVVLVLLVFVSSLLDAFLTLRHLQHGGQEANPWLALALTYGTPRFLQLKIGLTGVGVWLLAAHQQFPLARRGLHGLTLGYGVVLIYHLVLCLRLM